MATPAYDVIIVGGGPNGLTAAAELASNGCRSLVLERNETVGGGCRSAELTQPGFLHDVCSAVHPMAFLSPAFQKLNLSEFGLEWIHPEVSVAHPLENEPAVLLRPSVLDTASNLDAADQADYASLVQPLLEDFDELFGQLVQPFSLKKNIPAHLRFGLKGLRSARSLANRVFKGERAKALFAGCAAHSILPLEKPGTAAFGLIFLLSGSRFGWPVARGGSQSIVDALAKVFVRHGGEIQCGISITRFAQLPKARTYLFDLSPAQLISICGERLPQSYRRKLKRFRYGPAVFKVDYALNQPIPWKDSDCLLASTVHVGGSLDEVAESERGAWLGQPPTKPFIIVCQQSLLDSSRAPPGAHTGYAYCHVPYGWPDSPLKVFEDQLERFAPGFRDCIISRKVTGPSDLEAYNPSCHGGAITGGANTLGQLVARPTWRIPPYATPNPDIYLCSHSTPPGGGVHGMCGYNAAQHVLKSFRRKDAALHFAVAS